MPLRVHGRQNSGATRNGAETEKRPSSIMRSLAVRVRRTWTIGRLTGRLHNPVARHVGDNSAADKTRIFLQGWGCARSKKCPMCIPAACLFEQFYRALDCLPRVMAARHVPSIEPRGLQRRGTLAADVKAIHAERHDGGFLGKSADPLIEAFRIPPNGTIDDVLGSRTVVPWSCIDDLHGLAGSEHPLHFLGSD